MNVEYLQDTNEFFIDFKGYHESIVYNFKQIYQLQEEDEPVIPAWKFLNQMNAFGAFIRIHNLKKEVTISDTAKSILVKAKQSQQEIKDTSFFGMFLTEQEVSATLKDIGFTRILKWYQMRNVKLLLEKSADADYSVPGSGKTACAYALYGIRKKKENNLVMMVIGPKNVIGSWEQENIFCFSSPLTTCRLEGGFAKIEALLSGKFDVFFITYEQLLNVHTIISSFLRKNKVALYLDECHKMKGGLSSRTGTVILNLAHLPKYKTIMSGTPMPNSLEDLVSQHQFLLPSIKTNADSVAQQMQSLYVRTTKQEMNLRPYTIKKTIVHMNKEQKALYDRLIGEELDRLKYESSYYMDMVKRIRRYAIKMIQLSSNPRLLLKSSPELAYVKEFEEATKQLSPKLMVAIARAYELASKGKKVLIWSNFIDTIKLLERKLAPLKPVTIFGETPTGDEDDPYTREGKIKRFKEDERCFVMIANPMAASEGISLHQVCHYQVFIDRNYDSRLFEQAINRTHRVGLSDEREVVIEILLLNGSIDVNVDNRLDLKLFNMYQVLNDERLSVENEGEVTDSDYEEQYGFYSGMNLDDSKNLLNSLLLSTD
ncbi:SNF2-related protein [Bacillus sp. S14(2024)]|uniref:SNF2-related protein n=1 Tax=Bacillus sp. S14(2024) TaxID=3162884 RepID=UPI003D20E1B8